MMAMTVREILRAVNGTLLQGEEDALVTGVFTDSRKPAAGGLFLPWKGERFDGHDFIGAALSGGGAGCLTAITPESMLPGKFYILVESTKEALKALASAWRSRFDIPFVQITGSTGKTTCKEMVASVLSERYKTLRTVGNFNGDLGTPLLLLDLDESHEAAVVETGMDGFGQIRWLGEMIRPRFAAIINVGEAHMEFLGSREGVLRAKCEIFENLEPDGLAVLNGDDELLNTVTLPQRTRRCGLGGNCDVRVHGVEDLGLGGVRCTVSTGKGDYRLSIPSPGAHMVYPAAMAAVIGEALGLTEEEICRGVANFKNTGPRLLVERLAGGRVMLNDSYNANPQSMGAALRALAAVEAEKRIAFLGDMKELGAATERAHVDMGRLAGELGIDVLFCTGPFCREYMVQAAKDAGCRDVRWYEKKDDAYEDLARVYAPGAAILLKGSHFANRLDLAADWLREYPFE
ncbi:MAG: UDP-N-acetylmuramoyl-tripeptide--D-alanyl-D-alanine ligase [Oscillospiraceae bacterium]